MWQFYILSLFFVSVSSILTWSQIWRCITARQQAVRTKLNQGEFQLCYCQRKRALSPCLAAVLCHANALPHCQLVGRRRAKEGGEERGAGPQRGLGEQSGDALMDLTPASHNHSPGHLRTEREGKRETEECRWRQRETENRNRKREKRERGKLENENCKSGELKCQAVHYSEEGKRAKRAEQWKVLRRRNEEGRVGVKGEEGKRGWSQSEGEKRCGKGGPRELSMLRAGRDQSCSCGSR